MWCGLPTSRMEPSGRVKGTRGRSLGEKKGTSKGKLANCTKRPVHPESATRGEGAMRAEKTACVEGRPERCGAVMGDKRGEKDNGSETVRPCESKCMRKGRGEEAEDRGARCVKGQRSIASDGENGLGGVDKESSESESESEDALRATGKGICVSKT
jgi:hypothetical protein